MYRTAVSLLCLVTLFSLTGVQAQDPPGELPPGHPPAQPQLPPGHPNTQPQMPQGHPPVVQRPEAEPADVESIEAIIKTYYEVISGAKDQPRDWDRFRSLFIPDARYVTSRSIRGSEATIVITTEDFVSLNTRYFEGGGYFEKEVSRRTDTFGRIAHVFSTYEARHKAEDEQPYSRGINSIQLVYSSNRWWIATVMWDFERPDENPIPEQYLAAGDDN